MQCDKCKRHHSLKRDDACVIAPDVKKIYYVCSECGHTQVDIIDYSIRKNYNDKYEPDLWWEKLPSKEPMIDKSKTDPWEDTVNLDKWTYEYFGFDKVKSRDEDEE